MFGCLGSRSGSDLTSVAAVSAILEIWDSTSTGVNWRGEVGGPGGVTALQKVHDGLDGDFFLWQ